MTERLVGALVGTFLAVLVGQACYWGFVGWAHYGVWSNEMAGRAAMARAEQDRQIKVREAQASKDAASLLADAEVARAKGVAEANKIVADGLGGSEGSPSTPARW